MNTMTPKTRQMSLAIFMLSPPNGRWTGVEYVVQCGAPGGWMFPPFCPRKFAKWNRFPGAGIRERAVEYSKMLTATKAKLQASAVSSEGSRTPSENALYGWWNRAVVLAVSVLLLMPCFWHSRIEAGDLGSHVYNAWLAQLIEHHQLPGLSIAFQCSNVLFDLLLLRTGNLFGFVVAEKIVVSFAVLVFFWGCFSFLARASGKTPWLLTPFLWMLAYGYAFHVGFMNYYLSLGIAFSALAVAWRGGAG